MEHLNVIMLEKLCGLLFFLSRSKIEFEMVADEVEDCNLKTALNGLSTESDQYAHEIKMQLKTLGINDIATKSFFENCTEEEDHFNAEAHAQKGKELMNICDTTESTITKAYNEILNDFPFSHLREIMTYQVNSLRFAFMKIKTLNTARLAH